MKAKALKLARSRVALTALLATGLLGTAVPAAGAAATVLPRIDLKVLVLDDGGSAVGALVAELKNTGVPYQTVALGAAGRPTVNAAFLSDYISGRPHAKFQGVIAPNEIPFGAADAPEQAALAAYEKTFGIRQIDAYTWAHPEVGLDYTDQNGGWSGVLDGAKTQLTAAGKAAAFGYLDGPLTFEDNDPAVPESYGYAAHPRDGFTSYLDAPTGGSMLGQYAHDGRSELVVTFAYNQYQQQFQALAKGMVEWVTQGVHLGQSHNYLSMHVDDVFAPDARWDTVNNCTPGDFDCPAGGAASTDIRMTAADAQYAAQWEQTSGFTLDMVFNAGSGEEWKSENGGTDALTAQLLADKAKFRWMNHTYTHEFLGCVQDNTVVPWQCKKNADGSTQWMSRADISAQISQNYNWAVQKGLPVDKSEIVTGEHSGMKVLPQQPDDNPNLAGAFADNGIKWAGSDASREPDQRAVGATQTVPRHPMNVYYNVGKAAEMTDEYNWLYTSRANGGSGVCEDNPASTCMPAPLDTATGYASYIVPREAKTALSHVLWNDPRPTYVHQSNLAEERILYPVLDRILGDYKALYADNAPIVNLREKDAGTELGRRASWDKALASGSVTAYRIGTAVTVQAPKGVAAPVTAPEGTVKQLLLGTAVFGTPYAGERSDWTSPEALQSAITLKLPA
ncbi:hypothetical protein DWB77_05548 [Streptomyces hundungensis]|uniref:Uncharacterized protein n=1 Tax=Streptomyces hundungensis TaxID=1077946 RepID=A0A387HQ83_9ACTN|nr:hypothetical protein [Streptomyces hundungensis]AYG83352.1 hypothetical protein DWB77_05548 [Streptomyces hundungensis]